MAGPCHRPPWGPGCGPSEAWLRRASRVRPGLLPGHQGLCPIDAKTDFFPEKRKGEYCLTLETNTRISVALSVGVSGRYLALAMLVPLVASQGPPELRACTGHPPSSPSLQPAPGTWDPVLRPEARSPVSETTGARQTPGLHLQGTCR